MNKRLIIISVIYIALIVLSSVFGLKTIQNVREVNQSKNGEMVVSINEIKNSISEGTKEDALKSCDNLAYRISEDDGDSDTRVYYLVFIPMIISILGVITILFYLDISVLRPFRDMKDYASEVASGNMDASLKITRGNYFGDFSWAFDNMRKEIVKSRSAEKEAIENNKTVIATLSHDIKTPVASIRAYAEAFEANMDSTPEKRQKYLGILMQKCDEVSKLTNDLFIHSISEMNRLEVKNEVVDLNEFMNNNVRKLFVDENEFVLELPQENIKINADSKRLLQIFENLKNNSEKYAKTKIEITIEKNTDKNISIRFRDFGPGIPEEEIPFITGKFYRGKNSGNENGSGLGLYIVKELTEKMNGKVMLLNKNPGLEVVITIPCQSF